MFTNWLSYWQRFASQLTPSQYRCWEEREKRASRTRWRVWELNFVHTRLANKNCSSTSASTICLHHRPWVFQLFLSSTANAYFRDVRSVRRGKLVKMVPTPTRLSSGVLLTLRSNWQPRVMHAACILVISACQTHWKQLGVMTTVWIFEVTGWVGEN